VGFAQQFALEFVNPSVQLFAVDLARRFQRLLARELLQFVVPA